MSLTQSLGIAAAALVMSYASAGPPLTVRDALHHAHAAAERAEASAYVILAKVMECRDRA